MARSIVITGAHGQLGRALAEVFADESPALLGREELDVGDAAAVTERLRALAPDVVVNAAAYTLVDRAEDEPEAAARANVAGPENLARAARERGALLVHFSTDYVFDGPRRTPWREEDIPAPRGAYARTKLAGEERVRAEAPRHVIVRSAGLYGRPGRGGKAGNFVETVLAAGRAGRRLRVVDDQIVSPTSAPDLARKVRELIDRWRQTQAEELLGLYHVTNAGETSWLGFAREIFRRSGIDAVVEPVSSAAYGARAPRPAYSVLARDHLERLGLDDLRPWQEALAEYLVRRA